MDIKKIEQILNEEYHSACPRVGFVEEKDLPLYEKINIYSTQISYGIKLWGTCDTKKREIILLKDMNPIMEEKILRHYMRHFLSHNMNYLEKEFNKILPKRNPIIGIFSIIPSFTLMLVYLLVFTIEYPYRRLLKKKLPIIWVGE